MDWQDVEIAPKDGSWIILGAIGMETTMARWNSSRDEWELVTKQKLKYPFTHWMAVKSIKPPGSSPRYTGYVLKYAGSYVVDEHSSTNMLAGGRVFSDLEAAKAFANNIQISSGYLPDIIMLEFREKCPSG